MVDEIAFIEKEIQRLEEINKKTYYRLMYFRRVKKKLEDKEPTKISKVTQLDLFGT